MLWMLDLKMDETQHEGPSAGAGALLAAKDGMCCATMAMDTAGETQMGDPDSEQDREEWPSSAVTANLVEHMHVGIALQKLLKNALFQARFSIRNCAS